MSDNFSLRAVMKTDVKDFTKKFNEMSEQEISTIMSEHRQFVLNKVYEFTGKIIKGEGDAFWITFENVTNAVSCAKEIQLELYEKYIGEYDNQVIELRIVITVGEITYKEGDIFGDAVNLASRIESITPEKEIYISQSANLLLNKSQFSTTNLGKYSFKGQKDKIDVFKVNFKYNSKIFNQIIVFADMRSFTSLLDEQNEKPDYTKIEKYLDYYNDIVAEGCNEFNGVILNTIGDAFILAFDNVANLQNFLQKFDSLWTNFLSNDNNKINLMSFGCGYGKISKYQRFTFGAYINIMSRIEASGKRLQKTCNLEGNSMLCTNEIVQQSKKENVFNKSQFIEVKDMSSKTHTHEEAVSNFEKTVKKAFKEDISYFLPLHFFIPNPKSKK